MKHIANPTHWRRPCRAALSRPGCAGASPSKGIDEPFRTPFKQALAGKTVAYVPVAIGFDLTQGWFDGLKKELEPLGVKIVVRDPNWNTNAGAQAVTTLISEKPDVIVVHNPDVQTYAKLLQKAETRASRSCRSTCARPIRRSVFVGADWVEVGEKATEGRRQRLQGQVEQDRRSSRARCRRRPAPTP